MKLNAGDMVTITILDSIELFDKPPKPGHFNKCNPTSTIKNGQVAVVVSLDTDDGKCVYVVGSSGSGWTFGALLKRIDV